MYYLAVGYAMISYRYFIQCDAVEFFILSRFIPLFVSDFDSLYLLSYVLP